MAVQKVQPHFTLLLQPSKTHPNLRRGLGITSHEISFYRILREVIWASFNLVYTSAKYISHPKYRRELSSRFSRDVFYFASVILPSITENSPTNTGVVPCTS